jgi:phenylalanyl-tRNA synthetase beta chain
MPMKVPLSWLRDYVALDVPLERLADRLAVSTCEVEKIAPRGPADVGGNLGYFVVGRVVEAGKHPNADRLQLCRVDVGEHEPRQIVCGAWNFGSGATVAVGLPGAVLPGGMKLEQAKLRGTVSDGMILSERELELGEDHSGIIVLQEPAEPGTPLGDVLPLVDVVMELETTPNRPDLLAVYGIAREVAALFDLDLSQPPGVDPPRSGDEQVRLAIDDLDGCPRYVGRLFRDVAVEPSPLWLRARLTAAGMRPISNVVDVTNYVMLALGNPLHAFDFDTLAGGSIGVRRARQGEELRTLDAQLRTLDPADLVITDAERAIALAGIMGGEDTEVSPTTASVLLEAANFEPVGILRSSERLGLRTEGSNRWEKGVDPYLAGQAAIYATELIVATSGARWTGEGEVVGALPERPVVRLRPACTDGLLGLETAPEAQRRILERLGFDVDDGWTVTVPTWRARDVTREVDLVEEVARFRLDDVPFTLPERREMFGRLTKEQRVQRIVEDVLVGCGLSEAYTSSLVPSDPHRDALTIPVQLSAEYAALRTSLHPSLLDAVRRNLEIGNDDVALFEIARAYLPSSGELPDEHRLVGGILEGGFAQVKGVVEALLDTLHVEERFEPTSEAFLRPGYAARIRSGWLGEIHPTALQGWGAFELDLRVLTALVPDELRYEDVIGFPSVRQDLAFAVAEEVTAASLVEVAREAAGPELRAMEVFDVYRGEQAGVGRKSIAFRVVFQSPERTLSDEDAAALRARIVDAVAARFGGELRA